jgi:dipeptidyl aminopeptidase/acylaminoacyl peptidase
MKKIHLFLLLIIVSQGLIAQKKVLDASAYDIWKSHANARVSNDGNWVSFEVNPQEGDGVLNVKNAKGDLLSQFARGNSAVFSPNSDFVAFRIVPQWQVVRKAKLAKKQKEDMPKDSLGVFVFGENRLVKFPKVKSFQVATESASWLVYHVEKEATKKDTSKTEKKAPKNAKKPDPKLPDASELVIFNPVKNKSYSYKNVVEYAISRNGRQVAFIRQPKDTLMVTTVFVFNTETEKLDSIFTDKGVSKRVTSDNLGNQLTFLFSRDTAEAKTFHLYYSDLKTKQSQIIVDTLSKEIRKGYTPSENGEIYFSRDDQKIYFGVALRPKKQAKDTLLDDEKVKVDIWGWKDPLIQPQQLSRVNEDLKRTYLSVYLVDKKKIIQLADSSIPFVKPMLQGNGNVALAYSNVPYLPMLVYETPAYNDVYTLDLLTGNRKLILKKTKASFDLSPTGKFLAWFNNNDSSWYATSTVDGKVVCLTKPAHTAFFDEENDQPNFPDTYGRAGWTKNDEIVLYDKFDLWKFDPSGKLLPVNLTGGEGRKNKMTYRYLKTDPDLQYFPDKLLLTGFDEVTKKEGFFRLEWPQNTKPQALCFDDFAVDFMAKAKNEETYLWTKSSLQQYPDLLLSNQSFNKPLKLTDVNPQQSQYNWASVEMIEWLDFNGQQVKGLLYKPENYDASKKYPLIMYFYEKHTDQLNQHYSPRPSRSTINPLVYASNGYLVLMPDITYKTGRPGDCAYNAVVSGAIHLVEKGLVDKSKMGLQGQSWGGYEIAYLVTRTNLFAAASPGAPVSNMTSAYGGIRWESGMSRMFQYEQSQSRIGGTLWDKPLAYIENSPIFYAPRISTPLLIRHSDADGAVPWYQGIELFMALRRLNKPVWLVNYNGGPHNITDKRSSQLDWTIRMQQFFDHYLKGAPAPKWMTEGIPAIEKGKKLGYELETK